MDNAAHSKKAHSMLTEFSGRGPPGASIELIVSKAFFRFCKYRNNQKGEAHFLLLPGESGSLVADFATGPLLHFPILFLVPVAGASWFTNLRWGLVLAIVLSLSRLAFYGWWDAPQTLFEAGANAMVRIVVLSTFSYLVNLASRRYQELSRELKVLHGILPIRASCKRIRTEDASWTHLESFISAHSEAMFSYGMCPECLRKLDPDYVDDISRGTTES